MPASCKALHQARREVQPGGGRGNGTLLLGIDRLVVRPVLLVRRRACPRYRAASGISPTAAMASSRAGPWKIEGERHLARLALVLHRRVQRAEQASLPRRSAAGRRPPASWRASRRPSSGCPSSRMCSSASIFGVVPPRPMRLPDSAAGMTSRVVEDQHVAGAQAAPAVRGTLRSSSPSCRTTSSFAESRGRCRAAARSAPAAVRSRNRKRACLRGRSSSPPRRRRPACAACRR